MLSIKLTPHPPHPYEGRPAAFSQFAAGRLCTLPLHPKATRSLAQSELEALEAREERVAQLEKDRAALLASMSEKLPKQLHDLTTEEKNQVYRMLRLGITPASQGCQVSGALVPSCALIRGLPRDYRHAGRGLSFDLPTFAGSRPILS